MLEYAEETLWPVPSSSKHLSIIVLDDVNFHFRAHHNGTLRQQAQTANIVSHLQLLPQNFTTPEGLVTHMLPIAELDDLHANRDLSQDTANGLRRRMHGATNDAPLSLLATSLFKICVEDMLIRALDDAFISLNCETALSDEDFMSDKTSWRQFNFIREIYHYLNLRNAIYRKPTTAEILASCKFITDALTDFTEKTAYLPAAHKPRGGISALHANAFNRALQATATIHNLSAPPTIKAL